MKEYIKRLIEDKIEFLLKSVGGIQIVGPKYCGKSTTSKRYAKTVLDLNGDNKEELFQLASESPTMFLNQPLKPVLIDEWQIVHFVWNSIKNEIDKTGDFGQFILTGSVTDNTIKSSKSLIKNEKHTGTGRIYKLKMRTLSLFESGDSNGKVSLRDLKEGIFNNVKSDKDLNDYAYYICRGGWPLSINVKKDIALQQVKTFYNGLISEDLFSINDIPLRKDEAMAKKVLRAYSRCISSEASDESIRQDLGNITITTFNKYLLALNRLFIIEELEAWNPNLRSKTAIRSKNTRHFVDPSIAALSLGFNKDSPFKDIKTFGLLFESLVIRDLRIYCDSINASIYHYRDKSGREADAVIVFEDGSWSLVEVKLSNYDSIKDASNKLVKLAQDIDDKYFPKPNFLMVITASSYAYKDENGVYIVPLSCLKN